LDDANRKLREMANTSQGEREAFIVDELVSLAQDMRAARRDTRADVTGAPRGAVCALALSARL
jgi:hypothetical protein